MQRNYVFGQQGGAKPKTQGAPFSGSWGPYGSQPDRVYAGGSPSFNERTGQYQQPKQSQDGFQAYQPPAQQAAPPQGGFQSYRPGQAQPVQPSYGSPMPPSQQPVYDREGYGGGYGPSGVRSMDFKDRDGDGVDDRDQSGPSRQAPQMPQFDMQQRAGGDITRRRVRPPAPKQPVQQGRWAGDMPMIEGRGLPPQFQSPQQFQPPQQPFVPQVVGGKMNRGQRPQLQPRPSQGPRWRGDMPMIEGRGLPPQFQAPQQFRPPNQQPSYSDPAMNPNYRDSFQPMPRGAGFQQSSSNAFGQVASPQQNMAQRDAFIARLNAERAPLAATAGVYQTGVAPVAPPLNRDFGSLWGQAGNMVANGWTNPLAGLFG
jgi:hypothetical protein